MSNVKTINLTGVETEVNFEQKFMCFWVQNLGSDDVYASIDAGAGPESDGVIFIGAGASARVSAADLSRISTLYLTGSGKVQIVGCYSVHSPFMRKKKGGDDKNITLINLPLTSGNFDGYGYGIIASGANTYNSFTEDGLVLSRNPESWFLFTIGDYKPVSVLTIELDFMLTKINPPQQVIIGTVTDNSSSIAEVVINNSSNTVVYVTYGKTVPIGNIELNTWHHIKMTYYNNFNNVSVQLDDQEAVHADFVNNQYSRKNDYGIGMIYRAGFGNNSMIDGLVKNIKVTTPKEEVYENN